LCALLHRCDQNPEWLQLYSAQSELGTTLFRGGEQYAQLISVHSEPFQREVHCSFLSTHIQDNQNWIAAIICSPQIRQDIRVIAVYRNVRAIMKGRQLAT